MSMHACALGFPEVPSDAIDNLCGALGRSAEMLTEDLDKVTCPDCLRAIAAWGLKRAEALKAALRQALTESGCDGDLCLHAWHEAARAVLGEPP